MMSKNLGILFLITLVFGGCYWYFVAKAVCDVPISYRIGSVDERFNISGAEVRNVVSTAESMWEAATGRNLFTYDESGELIINFVFDERQQATNDAEALLETLDAKQDMNETVRSQYDTLKKEYDSLRLRLDSQTAAYEKRLAAYNDEVSDWNKRGGAPKDVFNRLAETQDELAVEQQRLNALIKEVNELVRKMGALASKGNMLASDYNKTVNEYNSKFTEGHEFTQGLYGDGTINIYEYKTREELELVLAHELGHALALEHVEGPESIMYRVMAEQTKTGGISTNDLAEFTRVCGSSDSFFARVLP